MKKLVCPQHEEDESVDFIFGETFDFSPDCATCTMRKECQKVYDEEEDVFYEHELVNDDK